MSSPVRRIISLLLVAAMFFSLSCEVFADTLTLPAALEEIGEEAFYGDESLDEVVVPYGTTTIGPRAFAYSGLHTITLPSTMESISSSAFEGLSNDFTILAPQYSAAYHYAMSNQFRWIDSERTRLQALADILDSIDTDESEPVLKLDELRFDLLSSEGVTDPEELRLIEEFNAGQEELAALTGELLGMRDDLENGLNDYQDSISENEIDVSDEEIHVRFGDFDYTVSGDAWQDLGEDAELIGVETLEDGSQIMIFTSDGETVYLKSTESSLFRVDGSELGDEVESRQYVIANGDGEPFVFTISESTAFLAPEPTRHPILEAIVDYFSDAFNNFANLCGMVDDFFAGTSVQLKRAVETATFNYNGIDKLYSKNPAKYAAKHAEALAHLKTMQNCFNALGRARGFWIGLNLYSSVQSLGADLNHVRLILELYDHGHPTEQEAEDYQKRTLSRDLSGSLSTYSVILGTKIAITATDIIQGLNTLVSLLTTASGPTGWGIRISIEASILMAKTFLKIAMKSIAIGLVTDAAEAQSRNIVLSLDARLHGKDPDTCRIDGIITDSSTKKPVSGVRVTLDDVRSTTTDAQGAYSFSEVSKGNHTLNCSKKNYYGIKRKITVSPDSLTFNLSMESSGETLSGIVTDASTGAPLSGVTVTLDGERSASTNTHGRYSFLDVKQGPHSLLFDKAGYTGVTAQLAEGQYTHNQSLTQKTFKLSGTVRDQSSGEGLSGVTVTLDGSRTTTTKASGQYSFSKVPAGEHTVIFSKSDYNTLSASVCISDQDETLNMKMTSQIIPSSSFDPDFWAWCVSQFDSTFDAETGRWEHDGQLSRAEVLAVYHIDCSDLGFSSLVGIKHFANLQSFLCDNNQLTELDVSGMKALQYFGCNNNQLTSLNVSGCSALSSLGCENNRLTSINVSGLTALDELYCPYNQITSLNISGCTALKHILCYGNQLGSLNLSICTQLVELRCQENQLKSITLNCPSTLELLLASNNQIKSMDLSGYSRLTELVCYDNVLTSLNVSGCSGLTELICNDTQLKSLDISGLTALERLNVGNTQLTSLNASGCSKLSQFQIWNCPVTTLDLSGCSKLTEFHLFGQLTSLDVSGCTAMTSLNVFDNQLTSLSVSGCTAMTELCCYNNQLTSLNVSGLTALKRLDCSDNQLESIDASGCRALTDFNYYQNPIKSLNLSGCSALVDFECAAVGLESLNVSGCSALPELECQNNQLTYLNVTDCSALEKLTCFKNKLESLDLSGCSALKELVCFQNVLTALDVSNCNHLTVLSCDANKLTALDVSHNKALTNLVCLQNQLTGLDVSGLTALTELICYENRLTRLNVTGCTALTRLNVHTNQLSKLDVSGFTALTKLICAGNRLTSLKLSGCSSLAELICDGNLLTEINISGCTALTYQNIKCDPGVAFVL